MEENNLPSRLSEDLNNILAQHETEKLNIGEMVRSVGEKGFGLLLCIASLPSALPVPAPGYSIPFGLLLFFLGLELLYGKKSPWLPEFLNRKNIRRSIISGALKKAGSFFLFLEKFIRPRYNLINIGGLKIAGLLVTLMAILMMIPIPLTNTLPAMVIFTTGVGILEKDGLVLLLAITGGCLATCFYTFFGYLISIYGLEAADHLRNMFF